MKAAGVSKGPCGDQVSRELLALLGQILEVWKDLCVPVLSRQQVAAQKGHDLDPVSSLALGGRDLYQYLGVQATSHSLCQFLCSGGCPGGGGEGARLFLNSGEATCVPKH